MSLKTKTEPTLTRRSFVKSTALLGAVCATGIAANSDFIQVDSAHADEDDGEETIVKTACRACIASCAVLAHVQNGRVIKIEGNPESPMSQGGVCAKGLSGIQALYHPNRNKYPMKRVGERGGNEWERITWDQAIEEIAEKVNELSDMYGSECISVSTGGGGNPHFSNIKHFGEAINTPNVWEPGCAQCYLPRMGASQLMYGAGKPNNLSFADSNGWDYYFTDSTPVTCLVMWGTDPSNSSVATGGRCIAELRAREDSIKTVVIDPRYTLDASKADVWLPIRPGTDVALELAWINWIIENERYDEEFCMNWTNMPYLINPETRLTLKATEAGLDGTDEDYVIWDSEKGEAVVLEYPFNEGVTAPLFGTYEVNGMECPTGGELLRQAAEDWTLEKAAEICWLDADQIEAALELYTDPDGQSGLFFGVPCDQYPQSQQANIAALEMEFMLGNVEKPGSMLQKFATAPALDQLPNAPRLLSMEKVLKRAGYVEHKGLMSWDMCFIPDLFTMMKEGDPYQIHMWFDRSGNKHAVLADSANQIPAAIENIDCIVHIHMYPTAFSLMCADYLLPCTEWLETNLPIPQLNTIVVRQEVTHLFETVEEGIIWTNIVQKCMELGNEHCAKAFDEEASFGNVLYKNEYEKQLMHLNNLDMTWEELCEAGVVQWATEDEYRTYYTYLEEDEDGKPQGFGTTCKKLEVYAEANIILGRTGYPWAHCAEAANFEVEPASVDYEPVPYYEEPSESPLEDAEGYDAEYPLVITNGRLPMFHHGTLRNVPWIREIYPVPELWINPVDAETYGIEDGEWAWIESRRNRTRGRAKVTTAIPEGVLYQERWWSPEFLDSDDPTLAYTAMNYNVLSKMDGPYNPEYGSYTLRGFTVKVYPCEEGAPEGTYIEPEDFTPWLPEPSDPTEAVFDYGA